VNGVDGLHQQWQVRVARVIDHHDVAALRPVG
jgi:hypothetical protein